MKVLCCWQARSIWLPTQPKFWSDLPEMHTSSIPCQRCALGKTWLRLYWRLQRYDCLKMLWTDNGQPVILSTIREPLAQVGWKRSRLHVMESTGNWQVLLWCIYCMTYWVFQSFLALSPKFFHYFPPGYQLFLKAVMLRTANVRVLFCA